VDPNHGLALGEREHGASMCRLTSPPPHATAAGAALPYHIYPGPTMAYLPDDAADLELCRRLLPRTTYAASLPPSSPPLSGPPALEAAPLAPWGVRLRHARLEATTSKAFSAGCCRPPRLPAPPTACVDR
jgi:hypothetical protein